jgi:hypothetical protein
MLQTSSAFVEARAAVRPPVRPFFGVVVPVSPVVVINRHTG